MAKKIKKRRTVKPGKKRGPKEETLKIVGDPADALARLLAPRTSKRSS